MYLNARRAGITAEDYSADKKIDNDTWDNWITCLKNKNGNNSAVVAPDDFNPAFPGDETDIMTAAVQIVEECINAGGSEYIFWDVAPDDGYYDGVMYLTDHGIVSGEGGGTFNPSGELQLQLLAAVLYRSAGYNMSGAEGLEAAKQFATNNGYMTTPNDWSSIATREEAVAAILKWKGVDISDVNTAILDRFDDAEQISDDTKPYLAYAVSHGLMSGTSETTLSPYDGVNRAQTGVILYRVLTGLDTSKMKDYRDSVERCV